MKRLSVDAISKQTVEECEERTPVTWTQMEQRYRFLAETGTFNFKDTMVPTLFGGFKRRNS